MKNITVITDITWDNFVLLNNKLKKVYPETFQINAIYGKTLECINNCSSLNNLKLVRHFSDNLSKTIYNLLKITDLWLIFTNNIEYNNSSRLVIEKCEEYNLKYIIISEHNMHDNYYSFCHTGSSFKKMLKELYSIESVYPTVSFFNELIYNDNFTKKTSCPLHITVELKNKLKQCHSNIEKNRADRSIKLLYDKNELKSEKNMKKTIKEFNHLNFNQNRINYYKNIK
jgi:hypothetical protein